MRTYWNTIGGLTTIKEWEPNCWIQVTCPTEEDQLMLEKQFNIPDYFMSDISDTDERARYEYDDGWMLIILRKGNTLSHTIHHCAAWHYTQARRNHNGLLLRDKHDD